MLNPGVFFSQSRNADVFLMHQRMYLQRSKRQRKHNLLHTPRFDFFLHKTINIFTVGGDRHVVLDGDGKLTKRC